MTMLAARDHHQDDLVAMWPRVRLSPEEVVQESREAYPSASDDEFLIDWLRGMAERAD